MWYSGHLILFVKLKNKRQSRFPVWENIVLFEADSEADAFAKAERRGKQEEGDDDGTFTWDGQPARWVFAGVRKLVLCENPHERPGDGTEISYSELDVASREAVDRMVAGKSVAMKYQEKMRKIPPAKSPKGEGRRQKKAV